LPLGIFDFALNSELFKVDDVGNVYQLINLEDGAHIYKWVKD
jgi:hypothetical protein